MASFEGQRPALAMKHVKQIAGKQHDEDRPFT